MWYPLTREAEIVLHRRLWKVVLCAWLVQEPLFQLASNGESSRCRTKAAETTSGVCCRRLSASRQRTRLLPPSYQPHEARRHPDSGLELETVPGRGMQGVQALQGLLHQSLQGLEEVRRSAASRECASRIGQHQPTGLPDDVGGRASSSRASSGHGASARTTAWVTRDDPSQERRPLGQSTREPRAPRWSPRSRRDRVSLPDLHLLPVLVLESLN